VTRGPARVIGGSVDDPGPLDWMDDAKCRREVAAGHLTWEIVDSLFFTEEVSGHGPGRRYCRGDRAGPPCPVIEQCLALALANDERFGVWGGTAPSQRQRA